MNVDSVANSHTNEWPWNLAVESPIAEGGALSQATFDLDTEQIDANRLWFALCYRRRQGPRFTWNIRLDQGLCRRGRRDEELPFHARLPVSRHATEIGEVARLGSTECNCRACPFARYPRRTRILIGKDNVMFGALAIDQSKLNHLALSC